ncbi:MAG: dethiobiotin synthase [Burkholderiales bacterium]
MRQIMCVIGTDTEIGKTYTCCKIMNYLAHFNHLITALKPISSGMVECEYGKINADVYQLLKSSTYSLKASQVSPFSFNAAIAPHIAAGEQGIELKVTEVIAQVAPIIQSVQPVSSILVEGIGGLMVPLNQTENFLDLLKVWNYPIILVVGIKLGCLNHTLLTFQALQHCSLPVVGWIANQIDPQMAYYQQNVDYLTNRLPIPCLATIPYNGELQPTKEFRGVFPCH